VSSNKNKQKKIMHCFFEEGMIFSFNGGLNERFASKRESVLFWPFGRIVPADQLFSWYRGQLRRFIL
jgi:hypothetical protein